MTELPFLLRLIDDPSPAVRARVEARLRALGPAVWKEISALGLELSPAQRSGVERAFALSPDEALHEAWNALQDEPDELTYLETSLLVLAEWQSGAGTRQRGLQLLDDFGSEFGARHAQPTALNLAQFLFEEKGLRGAPAEDYYAPLNSNLVTTLQTGLGLPITLTCLFMLIGDRCGVPIEGCNFPGHFLARDARQGILFDPYNGGRVLVAGEVEALHKAAPKEMEAVPSAREIVIRVTRNLSLAYHHKGEGANAALMLALGRRVEAQ